MTRGHWNTSHSEIPAVAIFAPRGLKAPVRCAWQPSRAGSPGMTSRRQVRLKKKLRAINEALNDVASQP